MLVGRSGVYKHIVQIDPLPWTLTFPVGSVEEAKLWTSRGAKLSLSSHPYLYGDFGYRFANYNFHNKRRVSTSALNFIPLARGGLNTSYGDVVISSPTIVSETRLTYV